MDGKISTVKLLGKKSLIQEVVDLKKGNWALLYLNFYPKYYFLILKKFWTFDNFLDVKNCCPRQFIHISFWQFKCFLKRKTRLSEFLYNFTRTCQSSFKLIWSQKKGIEISNKLSLIDLRHLIAWKSHQKFSVWLHKSCNNLN